jgi:tetratricopeptide (TPR) repeat protein
MKDLLLFSLLLLTLQLPFGSQACGNEYQTQTRPDGQATRLYAGEGGTSPAQFRHGFDTSSLVRQRDILQLRLAKDSSYQDLSDLALIELKIGDKYLGVQLLEKLYQQHPNEYPIVANLGTGYELTDNTELAYRFIKQALEINPEAHRGSEWIHLNILEQKLSPSPDYSNILKLGTGKSITAHFQSLNESQLQDLYPLKEQLIYQLEERIAFIAPEDAVVGQLLFDLADLVALTESVERSEALYHFAKTYDPGLILVEDRLQEIEEIRYVNPFDGIWQWLLIGIMLLVAGFYLLSWLIRKRGSSPKATKTA